MSKARLGNPTLNSSSAPARMYAWVCVSPFLPPSLSPSLPLSLSLSLPRSLYHPLSLAVSLSDTLSPSLSLEIHLAISKSFLSISVALFCSSSLTLLRSLSFLSSRHLAQGLVFHLTIFRHLLYHCWCHFLLHSNLRTHTHPHKRRKINEIQQLPRAHTRLAYAVRHAGRALATTQVCGQNYLRHTDSHAIPRGRIQLAAARRIRRRGRDLIDGWLISTLHSLLHLRQDALPLHQHACVILNALSVVSAQNLELSQCPTQIAGHWENSNFAAAMSPRHIFFRGTLSPEGAFSCGLSGRVVLKLNNERFLEHDSFFLSCVAHTQLNHWTQWVVSTQRTA